MPLFGAKRYLQRAFQVTMNQILMRQRATNRARLPFEYDAVRDALLCLAIVDEGHTAATDHRAAKTKVANNGQALAAAQ